MKDLILRVFILSTLLIVGCQKQNDPIVPLATLPVIAVVTVIPTKTIEPTIEATLVSDDPTFDWIILSGVDEHGLMETAVVALLLLPDGALAAELFVPTGTAAKVLERRLTGPQGLQLYYLVETVNGVTGWVPDYYVRRVAYLFNIEGQSVPIYTEATDESDVMSVRNVTPVFVKDPTNDAWWLIQTANQSTIGWVETKYIKESADPQFLLGEPADTHANDDH